MFRVLYFWGWCGFACGFGFDAWVWCGLVGLGILVVGFVCLRCLLGLLFGWCCVGLALGWLWLFCVSLFCWIVLLVGCGGWFVFVDLILLVGFISLWMNVITRCWV